MSRETAYEYCRCHRRTPGPTRESPVDRPGYGCVRGVISMVVSVVEAAGLTREKFLLLGDEDIQTRINPARTQK